MYRYHKTFGDEVLRRLTASRLNMTQQMKFSLRTQVPLDGKYSRKSFGRADLMICAEGFRLILEVKTKVGCANTAYQEIARLFADSPSRRRRSREACAIKGRQIGELDGYDLARMLQLLHRVFRADEKVSACDTNFDEEGESK